MEDVAARTQGRVAANGIELAYETFGDPGAPPVVLIMGLATQMIASGNHLEEFQERHGRSVRPRRPRVRFRELPEVTERFTVGLRIAGERGGVT